MESAKVSVIVPIYNQEKKLKQCIDSLICQTLKEIEIILVNDCSSDSSLKIMQKYNEDDNRIRIVNLEKNMGTSIARKRGVEKASGLYIMFLDSDDILLENACEKIYNEMQTNPADILQFGTEIVYASLFPEEGKKQLEDMMLPYLGSCNEDLCKKVFGENKWGYTLWNKAYSRDICKRAFSNVVDEYMVVGEDEYAYFLISFFADSYRGIEDKLYKYFFGTGITGHERVGIEQFKKYCTKYEAIKGLKVFLQNQKVEEKYKEIFRKMQEKCISEIIYQWRYQLSISDARAGYDTMLQRVDRCLIISAMENELGNDCAEILKRITDRKSNVTKHKVVRRIGVYHHRIRGGGSEKVVSLLIPLWEKIGYEIILITDEEATGEDFPLPSDIKRICIEDYRNVQSEGYLRRALNWESIVKENHIDTILYNDCSCQTIMWDTCMIKAMQCNMIVAAHSMFSGTMWYSPEFSCYLPQIYRMIDEIVVLSTVDKTFWENYCEATYIPNPIDIISKKEIAELDTKNVLWVGRISNEKRPASILEAFEIVYREVPDATLTIVGEGENPESLTELKEIAKKLKIEDAVDFVGFQKDVSKYYQRASVFSITSWCECFPLVLAESKSFGVPTAMFELPYLEMVKGHEGIVEVPQGDSYALGKQIINLLLDDELRKGMGYQARKSIDRFVNIDLEQEWKKLFDHIGDNKKQCSVNENVQMMLDMLFKDILVGMGNEGVGMKSKYEPVLERHEEVVNRHEEVVNRHEEVVNRHEEVINRHEEVVNRHEEVINRHEEVVNRHDDIVNRHEEAINADWEWLKNHEERINRLENKKGILEKICNKLQKN